MFSKTQVKYSIKFIDIIRLLSYNYNRKIISLRRKLR